MPRKPWGAEALKMLQDGMTRGEIATHFNVSQTRVCEVLRDQGHYASPKIAELVQERRAADEKAPWPRGRHQIGHDPFGDMTSGEIALCRRAHPEAAMVAMARKRGLPL